MKTTFKTYDQKQAQEKAKEYAAKYGVKFDFYHTGDGMRIVPVITRETEPIDDPARADAIVDYLKYWRFGCGFSTIANVLGYPVADVVGISRHLIQTLRVTFDVDRLGNIAGIRRIGTPAGQTDGTKGI